jgi:acyl carrier protein
MTDEAQAILATFEAVLIRIAKDRGEALPPAGWSTRSARELGLDSLDLAEMLLELELMLGVAISGVDLLRFETFEQLAEWLSDRAPTA